MPARSGARKSSLAWRVALLACIPVAAGVVLALLLHRWSGRPVLAGALALLLVLPATLYLVRRPLVAALAMFRALAGAVTSYRDNDFSFSLVWEHDDELGELVAAHNALGDTLRLQRLGLVQRELLLDTMLQNTPVALLLVDVGGRTVYGNPVARKLLGDGRRLEGKSLAALLAAAPEALRQAVQRGGDGLFALERAGEEQLYHLARRSFRLNGRAHELLAFRDLTAELRHQEVRTWKKVIRVISHELNNSLAPVISLARSGAELLRRGQHERLEQVFAIIAERAAHLDGFIRGYARFARLPAPRVEAVVWRDFIDRLRSQIPFELDGPLPTACGQFDPAQLEQALLNLLRNAHESGSPPAEVRLSVRALPDRVSFELRDRGSGMSEAVLASALLPFYSTKRGGTGLGLALVREIAEAHGGRVALANRDGGGLLVSLLIAQRPAR